MEEIETIAEEAASVVIDNVKINKNRITKIIKYYIEKAQKTFNELDKRDGCTCNENKEKLEFALEVIRDIEDIIMGPFGSVKDIKLAIKEFRDHYGNA